MYYIIISVTQPHHQIFSKESVFLPVQYAVFARESARCVGVAERVVATGQIEKETD